MAERLNVSYAAVQKWESGNRYPDFEMVQNIAEALGISVQDIYDNSMAEEKTSALLPVISSIIIIAVVVGACIIGYMHNGNGRKSTATESETTEVETTEVETTKEETSEAETTVNETTEAAQDEPITINIYTEFGSYEGEQKGYMAKILEDKLGIKVNYIPNTTGEYLNSNGDLLGDICVWSGYKVDELMEQGLLFDMYSDDFFEQNANTYLKEGKAGYIQDELNAHDGKLYLLEMNTELSSKDVTDPPFRSVIRWDLYKQLGYPGIGNLEDLAKVLGEMKNICPTDDLGNETYGLSLYGYSADEIPVTVLSFMQEYYGVMSSGLEYYDTDAGKYIGYLDENSYYLEMLKYFNKLYREGLVDSEYYTTEDELRNIAENGRFFFAPNDWIDFMYNTGNHISDGKAMMPIALEEAVNVTDSLSATGFHYWSISASSPYKEKCMELINYLATPEGTLTTLYGPQKLSWDYDENHNTYLVTSSPDQNEWGENSYVEGCLQINSHVWDPNAFNPDSNGDTFSHRGWKNYDDSSESAIEKDWQEKTGATNKRYYYLNKPYVVVPKEVKGYYEAPEALKDVYDHVLQIVVEYTYKAIFATSDDELSSVLDEMIKKADESGYHQLVGLR